MVRVQSGVCGQIVETDVLSQMITGSSHPDFRLPRPDYDSYFWPLGAQEFN